MTYPQTLKYFSYLTAALFAALMITPWIILQLFDLEQNIATEVFARRASVLFLGLTLLMSPLRKISAPAQQRAVALALAVTMLGLALLGTIEFTQDRVGPLIFLAISVEILFGVKLLLLAKPPSVS